MDVSKKEELIALGSALYLIGLEVEDSRAKLMKLIHLGAALCSTKILEENKAFNRYLWNLSDWRNVF